MIDHKALLALVYEWGAECRRAIVFVVRTLWTPMVVVEGFIEGMLGVPRPGHTQDTRE